MEYGSYGIRVNMVALAGTHTPDRVTPRQLFRPGMLVADDPDLEKYRRGMAEDIRAQQALRRRGLPEEQAAAFAPRGLELRKLTRPSTDMNSNRHSSLCSPWS
jgi:NAD(P)-dependent dehydrogenase (short-subunit alcohol dehydrogenase family)